MGYRKTLIPHFMSNFPGLAKTAGLGCNRRDTEHHSKQDCRYKLCNRQINRILTKKKGSRLNGQFNVPG